MTGRLHMTTMMPRQNDVTSYENFNVAIYCTVNDVKYMADLENFDKQFKLFTDNIKVGRVYLECYRGMEWCDKETLLKVKSYFESKGIATSGGITTNDDAKGEGFLSLCYSSEKGRRIFMDAVRLSAEVFDEVILDDFYFANCRCSECVKIKGSRSWKEMRLAQKLEITGEAVTLAKEVNPKINFIIKYPQWYEYYNETGYNPAEEPGIFDSIYTGTETRNPAYAQQHLPKYLSYFIMRYLESVAPERNLGGWFDPYECTYNLSSYLEQGYLTLFGKAREITLFCLGSLMGDHNFRLFVPALGQMLKEMDKPLGLLGNPAGAVAYRPLYGRGEDYIHNYLGMCGIPFEASCTYPEHADTVFLAESAGDDPELIQKMHNSLMAGSDVVVTSGLVRKLGKAFCDTFVNVNYTARKALVKEYANTKDNGLTISGSYSGDKEILIPQLDYATNDIWELAAAYGHDNNFPIVLRCRYGEGRISIITIPDDCGDLYSYPAQVLCTIRELFCKSIPVCLDGPSGIMLFAYDNNCFVVRSDLAYDETVTILCHESVRELRFPETGRVIPVQNGRVNLRLTPNVNYVVEAITE